MITECIGQTDVANLSLRKLEIERGERLAPVPGQEVRQSESFGADVVHEPLEDAGHRVLSHPTRFASEATSLAGANHCRQMSHLYTRQIPAPVGASGTEFVGRASAAVAGRAPEEMR